TAPSPRPGVLRLSLASQTCRRAGLLNCCHGIGTIRTCRWSLELGIMLYAIRGPRRVLSTCLDRVFFGGVVMPTDIHERALGPLARLLGLLAAIRWEAQFKLA